MIIGETIRFDRGTFFHTPNKSSANTLTFSDLAAMIFLASDAREITLTCKGAHHLHISTWPQPLSLSERETIDQLRTIVMLFTYDEPLSVS